ncbi:hypothetical protein ElyMa_004427200 [Elysia marginata]|uniref:Transmembrane protein n=1 Tax=Elysia marginata TaxID=1093978 RepID=A0AAV4HCF8_9GAST|nr:hypothetical protein ElyMa_004427200 [Elysia marginata]
MHLPFNDRPFFPVMMKTIIDNDVFVLLVEGRGGGEEEEDEDKKLCEKMTCVVKEKSLALTSVVEEMSEKQNKTKQKKIKMVLIYICPVVLTVGAEFCNKSAVRAFYFRCEIFYLLCHTKKCAYSKTEGGRY